MGKQRTYTDEQFIQAVKDSCSYRQVFRKLNLVETGGNYKVAKERVLQLKIDITHWGNHLTRQGWAKGKKFPDRKGKDLSLILIEDSYVQSFKLKARLIKEKYFDHKCYNCKNTMWLGDPIPIELHHINGNNRDNRIENLTLLCPNCHSKTHNYRGKNKNKKNIVKKIKVLNSPIVYKSCKECCNFIPTTKTYCSKRCSGCSTPKKFDVSKEELEKLIKEKPMIHIGKMFGVSDVSIRKRAKKLGIVLEDKRGYWAKQKARLDKSSESDIIP